MKNLRKILTIGIVVAGLLLPHLAHAVTLLSEGFEGTCEEVRTRWPYQGQILLGQFPCIHPMTINTDLRFVRSGSQSLKMQYEGGEIYGGAATHVFADNTRTEIWVTYDTYMRAPFYTGGDTSAGVGGVNTKGLYAYMNSPTSGARRWGWVPGWSWGTRNHNLGTQGCFDNLYNGVNVPYTSTTFFQNKTIVEQPWDTWVRHEVHYKLNTPGQANGLLEEYQTVGNGPRTLTTQYLNRQCLDNFLGGEMPSDARWFSMQIYRQYGNGELYIDNLTVTTEAVGSGGTVPPPPPPPPPSDTTPPTQPTNLSCTPGENSAACTWTASTDANSPITYSLQYRIGSNVFATGATSTTAAASLTGLSLSTGYDARVIATDPAGNVSVASPTGTFTTTAGGGGSTGTVAVDAIALSDSDTALYSSRSWTHTTGTGANRLLLVCLAASDTASEANAGASSVTYNGTALTFVRKDAQLAGGLDYLRTELWRLVGPPSGAGTVVATWAGSPSRMAVGRSISLTGASSTAPINANNGGTGSSTTLSAAVTSSLNDTLMVDCGMGWLSTGLTAGSNQTLQSHQVVTHIGGGAGNSIGVSTAPKAVAGAETMDWTQADDAWVLSALAVAPEVTVPVVPPTITSVVADATGADLTYGSVTPTSIRVITGNNDKGTISSHIYPIASFPSGRFTESWLDGLSYVCMYPLDASGVQNPSPTAHRCDSLVGIVEALDVTPPVISACQPSAALPFGTTSWTFSCSVDKPAVGKWGLSNVAYASLTNTASAAALLISGTATGLTNGSSTPIYVGAASTDALGDEHATVANTTVTIQVAAAPAADTTRPSDVANLAATNLGQVAELNWDAATDNVAVVAYQVYQSTGACSTYTVAGNPVTATNTLVNLAAATAHCWKVKALDAANNESLNFSNVATFTTSGLIDFELPSTMTNLRLAGRYSASVVLQWDIGTDNLGTPKALIEQCTVTVGTTCEGFETAKTEIVDRTLKVGLLPSTTYCWRGKHSDQAGNVSAGYSNVVCGTTAIAGTISRPRLVPLTARLPRS